MGFKGAFGRQLASLNTLDARERKVLKVLILFLGVLVLYFGIWSPVPSFF